MKISKNNALDLIDTKINQFNSLLDSANDGSHKEQEYQDIYSDTESLIGELFSKEDAIEFRKNVIPIALLSERSEIQKIQDYKKHLQKCISQLKAYKNRVQHFWDEDKLINWPLLDFKLQTIWNWVIKSWKGIFFVLTLIISIAGAINGWPTVLELVNSTLT